MDNLILPTDVFVRTYSLNFDWATHGLEKVYEEDIEICYKNKAGEDISSPTSIVTKGFFRQLKDDPEEIDHLYALFGKRREEILKEEKILWGYDYSNPEEVPFEAPRNAQGFKPYYIEVFHPNEDLTERVVKEAVNKYCRDFFGIPFSKVYLLGKVKRSEARKEFKKNQRLSMEAEELVKKGVRWDVKLTPQALEDLLGEEEISEVKEEIVSGYVEGDNYFVKLKDGSERRIGPVKLKLIE